MDLEKKASDAILSIIEQIKNTEAKTKQMEQELATMTKKYEKLMDKDYLEHVETTAETQYS